jgi:hypothetical protein
MELSGSGGLYVFTLQPGKVGLPGYEVARAIVPHFDADGRPVSLVVHGPGASTLLISEGFPYVPAVPRLELHADEGILALVLANPPGTDHQKTIVADGISVVTDTDGRPYRIVFEGVPVVYGVVDLVIHWRVLGPSTLMGAD